jgi:hypothetical protein
VIPFEDACALVGDILAPPARAAIVDAAARGPTLGDALLAFRESMRTDIWQAPGRPIDLSDVVRAYDRRTRVEGFHVLHDWDGLADRVSADTIPTNVLDYVRGRRGGDGPDRQTLAILLDYYLVHLLALLATRVWDSGDADANLTRVGGLLAELQGPGGSGHRFAADAETLLLVATSHFEVQEIGYDRLLNRVRALSAEHRTKVALGHAASMGCHLRFGFEATYVRDTARMRDDNMADYPWLCFALVNLMREYDRVSASGGPDADVIVDALLNGLSADARAFVGEAPRSLDASEPEWIEFRERFAADERDLLPRFQAFAPTADRYSPLSFFFNFSHNVLKGAVVDALLLGRPWPVALNDLLAAAADHGASGVLRTQLATTLMRYARENPSPIGGRWLPVIVYDPAAGRRAFTITMAKLSH